MRIELFVFLGFVCAVGVGLLVNMLTPKQHRFKPKTLWAMLVVLVLASTGVGIWQNNLGSASGAAEDPAGTPSSTPVLTPTPTVDETTEPPISTPTPPGPSESSTPTPEPTPEPPTPEPPTSETPGTTPPPSTQYLADLKPLYGDPGEGPATIGRWESTTRPSRARRSTS